VSAKNRKPLMIEGFKALNMTVRHKSDRGYFLGFFSCFFNRSLIASRYKSVSDLSWSTARYLSFFNIVSSIRNVAFLSILLY
jgi:hypothetical protein